MTIQTQIATFTQSNVDALTQSGSIALAGLQEIGTAAVALVQLSVSQSATTFKSLSAVSSPAELPNLAISLTKTNVDLAISEGRKALDLVSRVANDAVAPLTARFEAVSNTVRSKGTAAAAA